MPADALQLARELHLEQRRAWERGEYVPVESYLRNAPEIANHHEARLDLVYGEYLLREARQEAPQVEEYAARFPDLAVDLRRQTALHRALENTSVTDDSENAAELDTAIPLKVNNTHLEYSDVTAVPGPLPSLAPRIRGYEIVHELGRGGMGVVYKARQLALGREVAIKVILASTLADSDRLRRFQTEAATLARLRHPNFVEIHDYGLARHAPYLVLEYVDGGSLAQRIAGVPQPVEFAARIVETLAQAMHHAHSMGIVHRDLKPANVLVTVGGVLKIADFGMAKILPADLTDNRESRPATAPSAPPDPLVQEATRTGALFGTPGYMAPEQAAAGLGPIGPPTDVHALGIILFELLTGRVPFVGTTPWEVLQQVVHREPLSPRRWRSDLPRDLETICCKCLAKVPSRRYASAAALADDLRRFQTHQPILARPVGWVGRTQRWCQRNPLVAGLTGSLAATIVAGLCVTTGLWWRASYNLRQSQANLAMARDAVDQFCTRVSDDERLQQHDLRELRSQLLRHAVAYHERFLEQQSDLVGAQLDLAATHVRLGRLAMETDSIGQAESHFREAIACFQAARGRHSRPATLMTDLAQAESELGWLLRQAARFAEAEPLLRKAVRHAGQEPRDLALPWQRNAVLVSATAGTRLGHLLRDLGRHAEAEAQLRDSIALLQDIAARDAASTSIQDALASAWEALGFVLRFGDIRRWEEARIAFEEALHVRESLSASNPEALRFRFGQATILREIADIRKLSRRTDEAILCYRRAIGILEETLQEHGNVSSYRYQLAQHYDNLAMILQARRDYDQAIPLQQSAWELMQRLVVQYPENVHYEAYLGRIEGSLGDLEARNSNLPRALELTDQGVSRLKLLTTRHPELALVTSFLRNALSQRAEVLELAGRYGDAVVVWQQVVDLADPILGDWFEVKRGLAIARTGDHRTAVRLATDIADRIHDSGRGALTSLLGAAQVYLVAADHVPASAALPLKERQALEQNYRNQALELLQRLADAGFSEVELLETNSDFAALRGRKKFSDIVAQIRSQADLVPREPVK